MSSITDFSKYSVSFLTVNMVGMGIVLFVANLWSQVFSQWMDSVQDESMTLIHDGKETVIKPTSVNNGSAKQGLWVATLATILAGFFIWGLIRFMEISNKEWKIIKNLFEFKTK